MSAKAFSVRNSLQGSVARWYETEKNTAALIKAVLASREMKAFSGDDLWSLLRLTWITASGREVAQDNWKCLKVPALALLYGQSPVVLDDLLSTIQGMSLPSTVVKAAARTTGIVNFRNVWRNSCRKWCTVHRKVLIGILHDAGRLPPNDQARFSLAARIDALPGISSPNGKSYVGAAAALTPIVACLDPSIRFPIINGRGEVRDLLRSLKLSNGDLERQVKGIVNLIGQFGIEDALTIDVLADEIAEHLPASLPEEDSAPNYTEGIELPYLDEAERLATGKSQTIRYRNRHNKMTDGLKDLFSMHELKQGNLSNCRYDVLIKDYDNKGRDLLVEAKPDPDRGAIRIAVGQVLDYRRHLPNCLATDLAIMTIGRPSKSYVDFLLDLQISILWFSDEKCSDMEGEGKAWSAIKK